MKPKLKEHTIKVNDAQIYYYTYGEGSPLLFIHGHRSDTLRWGNIILYLGEKFKVYSPDLPGFGKSPPLKGGWHTMIRYAQYLVAFTQKVGLTDYVLVGGSMGGIIALYMLKNPDVHVRKLLLLGTPYDKAYFRIGKKTRRLLSLGLKTAVKGKIATIIADFIIGTDFLFYRLLKRSFPPDARKEEIIKYEMRQWRVMPAKIWMQTFHDILNVNFSKEKFKTNIPTLIVASKGDHFIKPKETIAGLQKICPNSRVVYLPFKRHVPRGEITLEQIKELSFLFGPFLNENPTQKLQPKTK